MDTVQNEKDEDKSFHTPCKHIGECLPAFLFVSDDGGLTNIAEEVEGTVKNGVSSVEEAKTETVLMEHGFPYVRNIAEIESREEMLNDCAVSRGISPANYNNNPC